MKSRTRKVLKTTATLGILGAMSWQVRDTRSELHAERSAEIARAEAAQELLDSLPDIASEISLLAIEKQVQYVDEYNAIPSGCVPYVLGQEERVPEIVRCDLSKEQRTRIADRLEDLENQRAELGSYFDDSSFFSLDYYRTEAQAIVDDATSNSVITDLLDQVSGSFVTGFDSETGQLVYDSDVDDFEAGFMQPYIVFAFGGLALFFMATKKKEKPKPTSCGADNDVEESDLLTDGVGNH